MVTLAHGSWWLNVFSEPYLVGMVNHSRLLRCWIHFRSPTKVYPVDLPEPQRLSSGFVVSEAVLSVHVHLRTSNGFLRLVSLMKVVQSFGHTHNLYRSLGRCVPDQVLMIYCFVNRTCHKGGGLHRTGGLYDSYFDQHSRRNN